MSREYYLYAYRLDDKDAYLIWFTNEKDGLVADESGFVPSFENVSDLQNYARRRQIGVDTAKPKLVDFDLVRNWLNGNLSEIDDYNVFLDAWNLFEDLSNSVGGDFDQERKSTNNVYHKIFWGCNISAVTPEGEFFTPRWTKKELKVLRRTLNTGFRIFREKVKAVT